MPLPEALAIYGANAPVCLCKHRPCLDQLTWCGPQRKAQAARRAIPYAIPRKVATALNHAWTCEGRAEFDWEWARFKSEVEIAEGCR